MGLDCHVCVKLFIGTIQNTDVYVQEIGQAGQDGTYMYLCKIVLKMQMHGQCKLNRYFKGAFGKHLSYCNANTCLDSTHMSYLHCI